jgi:hypothetical protein
LPAVLRISGNRNDLDERIALSEMPFVEALAVVRKRRLHPDADFTDTTYNLTISDADGDSIPAQIDEAIRYLRRSGHRIAELHRTVVGSRCVIDFSWNLPDGSLTQCNTFPVDLIGLLSDYGIALEVSVYGSSTDRANNPMQPSGESGVSGMDNPSLPLVDR